MEKGPHLRGDRRPKGTPLSGGRNWTYDGATKGVGKLNRAQTNLGYDRTYSFDTLGRTSSIAVKLDSGQSTPYSTSMTYDTNGRLDVVTNPSGFALKRIYNTLSFNVEIRHAVSAQSYWILNSVNADGSPLSQTFGNGVVTTQSYEASTGRLSTLQTKTPSAGTPDVVNFAYTYDSIGNLRTRNDVYNGLNETFDYDTLNRLITITAPTQATKTVAYNAIGNITSKSDVGTYTYPTQGSGSVRPHAVSSISGTVNTTYAYDANGNMTSGNGRTVTWNAWDMPVSITRGGQTVSFDYGPEHQRIKQVAPSETTQYVSLGEGAHVERMTFVGSTMVRWVNYLYASGGMVGSVAEEIQGSTTTYTRYFHKDHLGSVAGITTTNISGQATVFERLSYDAWGKRRFLNGNADPGETITSSTNRGYTSHEHLEEVGLIHMNGRVFDPLVARFISTDPFIQDPTNSQSLNRYSYVNNNSLTYTDPTGYFSLKSFFAGLFRGNITGTLGLAFLPPVAKAIDNFYRNNEWLLSIQSTVAVTVTRAIPYFGWLISAAVAGEFAAYRANIHGGSFSDMLRSYGAAFGSALALNAVGTATRAGPGF